MVLWQKPQKCSTTLLTFSSVNQSYLSPSKANVLIAKATLSCLFIYLFAYELKKEKKNFLLALAPENTYFFYGIYNLSLI